MIEVALALEERLARSSIVMMLEAIPRCKSVGEESLDQSVFVTDEQHSGGQDMAEGGYVEFACM